MAGGYPAASPEGWGWNGIGPPAGLPAYHLLCGGKTPPPGTLLLFSVCLVVCFLFLRERRGGPGHPMGWGPRAWGGTGKGWAPSSPHGRMGGGGSVSKAAEGPRGREWVTPLGEERRVSVCVCVCVCVHAHLRCTLELPASLWIPKRRVKALLVHWTLRGRWGRERPSEGDPGLQPPPLGVNVRAGALQLPLEDSGCSVRPLRCPRWKWEPGTPRAKDTRTLRGLGADPIGSDPRVQGGAVWGPFQVFSWPPFS